MRQFLVTVVVALVCTWAPQRALAEGFEVSPVMLKLSASVGSTMLALTNRSPQTARFQVSAVSWQEKPDGGMVLAPTRDVMFFPALLTLNPEESRNLRVGLTIKPGTAEKAYRILVQELPNFAREGDERLGTVGVLAKMSIPVFLEPQSTSTPKPSVTGLQLQGAQVKFTLRNPGNVHLRPKHVVLRAKNGSTVLHTAELSTWYVLAGGTRDYVARIPETYCSATNALEVEVAIGSTPAIARVENVHCTP